MRVTFAQSALSDLKVIGDYIAQDSEDQAARFVRRLRNVCDDLGRNPRRFTRYGNGDEELRRRVFDRYLIFYVVEADRVSIARILNSAMNVDAILFGEDD